MRKLRKHSITEAPAIEGVMPFLSPGAMRKMMLAVAEMDDHALRVGGLVSMILGVVTLYLVN